jgi:hypothetical protein
MKKIFITLTILASSMMLVNAEAPYKMGVGATVGSLEGFSFKTFFGSHFGLQADLGYTWWDATVGANVNLMYQAPIKNWDAGRLDWYAGGGLSAGYILWYGGGKVGVNAIGGVEWTFSSIPLALSADFRPGCGIGFGGRYSVSGVNVANRSTFAYFDWGFNIGCRYTIGK